MISIKKFLSGSKEAESSLMEAVRALVRGIHDHIPATSESFDFRTRIQQAINSLVNEIEEADLVAQVSAVVEALESYDKTLTGQQDLRAAELRHMVKMLTSTVAAISAAGNTSLTRLGEIEKQVLHASELDDVRAIKGKLSDCLVEIRRETDRQRQTTVETVDRLAEGLDVVGVKAEDISLLRQGAGGLSLRSAAEGALARAGQDEKQAYAVVMVLDRLQAVNGRFGREVGDEVLRVFTDTIRKRLPADDDLFRWDGPALIALVRRSSSLIHVRREMAQILETNVDHTIETGSRTILIPSRARWAIYQVNAVPRLLYQKIDTFISIAGPQDQ